MSTTSYLQYVNITHYVILTYPFLLCNRVTESCQYEDVSGVSLKPVWSVKRHVENHTTT